LLKGDKKNASCKTNFVAVDQQWSVGDWLRNNDVYDQDVGKEDKSKINFRKLIFVGLFGARWFRGGGGARKITEDLNN
jgi:hypothetical protein